MFGVEAQQAPGSRYLVRAVVMGMGDAIYVDPAVLEASYFDRYPPWDARGQLETLCVQGGGYAEELTTFALEVGHGNKARTQRTFHVFDSVATADIAVTPQPDETHEISALVQLGQDQSRLEMRNHAVLPTGGAVGLFFPFTIESSKGQPGRRILAIVVASLTGVTDELPVPHERLALGCGAHAFEPPRPTEKHFPICPATAIAAACKSRFVVEVTVDELGMPRDPAVLWVLDGPDDLADVAQEAILKWRFLPGVTGNRAVVSRDMFTVRIAE